MKKLVVISILLMALLASCSTKPQEKIVDEFTKELGTPTEVDTASPQNLFYMWKGVDLSKTDMILGLADKATGMLPNKEVDRIVFNSKTYETPEFEILLEIESYEESGNYLAKVKLFIQNK